MIKEHALVAAILFGALELQRRSRFIGLAVLCYFSFPLGLLLGLLELLFILLSHLINLAHFFFQRVGKELFQFLVLLYQQNGFLPPCLTPNGSDSLLLAILVKCQKNLFLLLTILLHTNTLSKRLRKHLPLAIMIALFQN